MVQQAGKKVGLWLGLKGLLVLLVILDHTFYSLPDNCRLDSEVVLFRFIFKSSGMVLFTFFLVSGYMLSFKEKRSIWKQYLDYVKIWGITLLGMLLARGVHNCLAGRPWYSKGFLGLLVGGIYGSTTATQLPVETEPITALWFFIVFMNASLLLKLIMKIKNGRIRHMIIFGAPLLFFLWAMCTGQTEGHPLVNLPLYPVQTCIAVLLLYLGHLIRKHELFFRKTKWYEWCLFLGMIIPLYLFGNVYILENTYRLGVLDFVGTLGMAMLFMYLYLQAAVFWPKAVEWLMWLGRRSHLLIPLHCVDEVFCAWKELEFLEIFGPYGAFVIIYIFRCCVVVCADIILENFLRKVNSIKRDKEWMQTKT